MALNKIKEKKHSKESSINLKRYKKKEVGSQTVEYLTTNNKLNETISQLKPRFSERLYKQMR